MIPATDFARVLDGLSACLRQWREDGETEIETSPDTLRALAARAPSPPAPRPAAAVPERIARPAPARLAAPSIATRPAEPAPRPTPPPAAPAFACLAERLVELHDAVPADRTRVRVVAEAAAFQGSAGDLLAKMLRAAGYTLVGNPQAADVRAPGAAVLLIFGPAALAGVKPESMFNLVRGKWVRVGDFQAMVTFDPVFLEQSVAYKKLAWEDLQKILEKLALSVPSWVKR